MANKEFWSMDVTIYLYHFSRPLYHAKHYLGSSDDLTRRCAEHGTLQGSKLMRAAAQAGIKVRIARTWKGTPRYHEALLHTRKNHSLLCPICVGPKALKRGIFNPTSKTKTKSRKNRKK